MTMDPAKGARWYVISLRPRGEHAALRRAAARRGAGLIALSPWVLQDRGDDAVRDALRLALEAPRVVVTSPAAVRAAARLQPLLARPGQAWFAVGAASAAALRRCGIDAVSAPTRMDSEGLLALPGLQHIDGDALGLITAPGGRGTLTPALLARGAQIRRADVYARVLVAPSARSMAAVRALAGPAVLALTSEQALQHVLSSVPNDVAATLRAASVVAASQRLADIARGCGFHGAIVIAAGPRPRDLFGALDAAALAGPDRTGPARPFR